MSVAAKLRDVNWARHGVVYAVLFGSALRGERFRDIDIAVLFDGVPTLDRVLALVRDIADALDVSEDRVDLVVLNRDDTPCILVEEALGRGMPVYCRDLELCIEDMARRLEVCWDFEVSYRKLDLLRVAVEAVKRRWGCSEGS